MSSKIPASNIRLKRAYEPSDELRSIARGRPLTLVYSARDGQHNNAIVLRNVLLER